MSVEKGKKHQDKLKTLGLNIAYERKQKNMTQAELADAIGISRTHLSNIEAPNATKSVSVEVIFDIADALKINPSKLMDMKKE